MEQSTDQWHSIRPWIRRFALSVNQVSSVSATFTLKSALAAKSLDPELESVLEGEQGDSHTEPFARSPTVSDALTQGLSVKVNSSPWQRVLLRVDEESDEATVIVFGLMPGRQYDVELGIAHPLEPLRSQITTDGDSPDRTDLNSDSSARDQNVANGSSPVLAVVANPDTIVSNPLTTPPDSASSPSSSPTASPTLSASDSGEVHPSPTSAPSVTLEDKIRQLNQTLSLLQSERDSLALSLKTTRRDAQKADAVIRADIETLKRASDKFTSVEQRARQKVLALQETVKQTLAAAAEISASVTDVETSLPALREQQADAEKECKMARQRAAQAREEREALELQEKKRIDSLQTELAGLGSKLEKLNSKREKLENSVIPELEEELRRIEEEIAAATWPSSPTADHLDTYHLDPGLSGVSNQSASSSALPSSSGIPEYIRSTSQDSIPGPIENPRRKRLSHPPLTTKQQQPQVQKPIQILRPLHHPHQVRSTVINNKSTTISTTPASTLSSLAAPFEPSPKRQAQLQSTLGTSLSSNNPTPALKAELNQMSSVFNPRMGFTISSTPSTTSTSHQSMGSDGSNKLTPSRSAWSRANQKPRRSDVE